MSVLTTVGVILVFAGLGGFIVGGLAMESPLWFCAGLAAFLIGFALTMIGASVDNSHFGDAKKKAALDCGDRKSLILKTDRDEHNIIYLCAGTSAVKVIDY